MVGLKSHWISALAALAAGFLLVFSIGGLINPDDGPDGVDRIFWVVTGSAGLALFGGLWSLRRGFAPRWVAYALIVVASFWWLLFLPAVVAVTVLVAGVMKRGLERELSPI